MVLLDQLWDDVVAGPQPNRGLKQLKKVFTKPKDGEGNSNFERSMSMPLGGVATPPTPGTPTSPSPTAAAQRDNIWRSVFNPGSNTATRGIGSEYFDKPQPNSPTVYDWLYSGDTRSKHR